MYSVIIMYTGHKPALEFYWECKLNLNLKQLELTEDRFYFSIMYKYCIDRTKSINIFCTTIFKTVSTTKSYSGSKIYKKLVYLT